MRSGTFTCYSDCPNRIPGCHATCEKYLGEKAKYNKQRATEKVDDSIRNYMVDKAMDLKNQRAIRKKGWAGYSKRKHTKA
jgi:hypothetical protein